MKILLKLLFVSSTITPLITNEKILNEVMHLKNESSEFYEYKDQVHNEITFTYPDLYSKNYDEYKFNKNNVYVKKNFNEFYSIEDLRMDQYQKYFENSKLVFNFDCSVMRWGSGRISSILANDYFITENEFEVTLKERQKFIDIENAYSYQNYNSDSFIQVLTEMKIERVKKNNQWGLKFTGSIAQEIIIDPANNWKSDYKYTGAILSKYQGLNLNNIEIEFNTKEAKFDNSDSQLPVLEVANDLNSYSPDNIIRTAINKNEDFKSRVGLDPKKKYLVVDISADALYSNFKDNSVVRIILKEKNNTYIILTRLIISKRVEEKYLYFERTTNDLNHFIEQVYEISKNYYDIKDESFKFLRNSAINIEAIKRFNAGNLKCKFEFLYTNNQGQKSRIKVTNHKYKEYKETLKRQTWDDVKFIFLPNFKNDSKLTYVNEDKECGESLKPHDIILSDKNVSLNKGDKKIIYFENYNYFSDLYYQTPPQIKLTRISENELLLEALSVWEGQIEIDAINANEKYVLKINITNSKIRDFSIKNNIEVRKGIQSELQFDFLDPNDNIAIINSNSNLEVKFVNNKLLINSSSNVDQKFIIFSNETKKQVQINVKTLFTIVKPEFENNFEVFTINSSNTFEFKNKYLLDFGKLKYSSKYLKINLVSDKFQFYNSNPGNYQINFQYFDFEFSHEILLVDNLIYKETNIELDENNHFKFSLNKNRVYNASSEINYEVNNNSIEGSVEEDNQSITLYKDGELNKINFVVKSKSIKKDDEDNAHLKWLIPTILIPVALSISGFIFVYLKRKK